MRYVFFVCHKAKLTIYILNGSGIGDLSSYLNFILSQKIILFYYILEEYSEWYIRKKDKYHHQEVEYIKNRIKKIEYMLNKLHMDPITEIELKLYSCK